MRNLSKMPSGRAELIRKESAVSFVDPTTVGRENIGFLAAKIIVYLVQLNRELKDMGIAE